MAKFKNYPVSDLKTLKGWVEYQYGFDKLCNDTGLTRYQLKRMFKGETKKLENINRVCDLVDVEIKDIKEWSSK